MDTVKGVATIVAYGATGALVGRLVDVLGKRIFDTFDWDGAALRAGVQLFFGVAALSNVTSTLTGNLAIIDDSYGAIPAMWYFYFSSQPNLQRDIKAIVESITNGVQAALAPRVSEESILSDGEGGTAINDRQADKAARTKDVIDGVEA